MPRKGTRRSFMHDAAAATAAGVVAGTSEAATASPPAAGESSVYARLGVRPIINGVGTVTVLGGSLMAPACASLPPGTLCPPVPAAAPVIIQTVTPANEGDYPDGHVR